MPNNSGIIAPGGTFNFGQGRALTAAQRNFITAVLRNHSPRAIHILLMSGSKEVREYANQIRDAIHSSDWREVTIVLFADKSGEHGVSINTDDEELRRALALAFEKADVSIAEIGRARFPDYPNAILVGEE